MVLLQGSEPWTFKTTKSEAQVRLEAVDWPLYLCSQIRRLDAAQKMASSHPLNRNKNKIMTLSNSATSSEYIQSIMTYRLKELKENSVIAQIS